MVLTHDLVLLKLAGIRAEVVDAGARVGRSLGLVVEMVAELVIETSELEVEDATLDSLEIARSCWEEVLVPVIVELVVAVLAAAEL